MGAMRGKSKINHMQRAELEYGVAERGPLAFLLAGGDEAKQSTSVNSNTVICQLEEDQPRKKRHGAIRHGREYAICGMASKGCACDTCTHQIVRAI